MDIMDLLLGGGDPVQQQKLMAQALRAKQNLNSALQQNSQDESKYDLLNFAATAAGNNPSLASATGMLQKSAQARGKVTPLGQSSLIVGDQVLDNPGYADQKNEDRSQRLLQAAAMLQARREAQATREQIAADAEAGRNERAADMRALRMTLGGIAQSNNQQRLQDKADQQHQQMVQRQLAQYGNKLTSERIPEFAQMMDNIDNLLNVQYPKAGSLPGYGRVEGYVPSQMLPAEAQNVRSTIQQAANVILKSRSGAAVTDQEYKRFLNETAGGGGYDEATLRKYWPRMMQAFQQHAGGLTAGYGDDVINEYVANGGRDFRLPKKGTPAPAKAGPGRIKIDVNGNIVQ